MLKKLVGGAIGLLALALAVVLFAPAVELASQTLKPAVKGPNQPPLASDPAGVVAISPNSPLTQGTVPWVDSITEWNNVALGNPTPWGTPPTGATVIGVNSNVLTTVLPPNAAQETGGNLAQVAANTAALVAGLAPLGAHTTAGSPTVNIASDQATPVPVTVGGAAAASPYHLLSAASTNSTSVKGSAGTVFDLTIIQTTTTLGNFRFYDSATAPTCSSATGVVANYAIQSNATTPGLHLAFPQGKKFVNGIAFCLTGAVADNDNTAFVTGAQVNIDYQ